eukprot:COSAG02_NODE_178_length_31091_cov_59.242482_18_plen_69_part_00
MVKLDLPSTFRSIDWPAVQAIFLVSSRRAFLLLPLFLLLLFEAFYRFPLKMQRTLSCCLVCMISLRFQ